MSKETSLIPTVHEMQAIEAICKYAVDSKYFQSLGGFPGVMCIALYAREIGVPTMTAIMGGFSNVQGKITMSADLMHSLLRSNGVRLKIVQSDETRCEIYGKRNDTGDEYTSVYTIENARKAGLVKAGGAYEKNTSDMLFARCISRLRRRLAPDIATRSYVEGELDDDREETQVSESVAVQGPSAAENLATFRATFKPIENMDYDLNEFVESVCQEGKYTAADTIKQALKKQERFSNSYLKWVEEKIASQPKTVEVKAEQGDLLNLK